MLVQKEVRNKDTKMVVRREVCVCTAPAWVSLTHVDLNVNNTTDVQQSPSSQHDYTCACSYATAPAPAEAMRRARKAVVVGGGVSRACAVYGCYGSSRTPTCGTTHLERHTSTHSPHAALANLDTQHHAVYRTCVEFEKRTLQPPVLNSIDEGTPLTCTRACHFS